MKKIRFLFMILVGLLLPSLCANAEAAGIDTMSLLLDGDIGVCFHAGADGDALRGGSAVLSIGGANARTETRSLDDAERDSEGDTLLNFMVSSVELAEPVTVTLYDRNGNACASATASVEDYNRKMQQYGTGWQEKEMIRTLVNYGYFAQRAQSSARGWSIGADYAAIAGQGGLSTTAEELSAYRPVITGNSEYITDISISLLLDNRTTLCLYFMTADGGAPSVTVDGIYTDAQRTNDGRWAVYIPNIDVLRLSEIHTVTADGCTVYLSALSYGSAAADSESVDAIRALHDYYLAALRYTGKTAITNVMAYQPEVEYTGEPIAPELAVLADGYPLDGGGILCAVGRRSY